MKTTTVILALIALVTGLLAWSPRSDVSTDATAGEQRFFGPELVGEDPGDIRALTDTVSRLSIGEWHRGRPRHVDIVLRDGRWLMASHYDYPADGVTVSATGLGDAADTRRLGTVGQAVGSLLGVPRLRRIGDDPSRHHEYGVVDPLDLDVASEGGRGVRVALDDRHGTRMLDLVIGKQVPGEEGLRYVREADSPVVYVARVDDQHLTAHFQHWVEPNPIDLERDAVRVLAILNAEDYDGVRDERFRALLARDDARAPWRLAMGTLAGTIDQDAADAIVRRLATLSLAAVVPRTSLAAIDDPDQSESYLQQLHTMGFTVSPRGQLVGDQGALRLVTADGLVYDLSFGDIAGRAAPPPDAAGDDDAVVGDERAYDRLVAIEVAYSPEYDEALPLVPEIGDDAEFEQRMAQAAAKDARAGHQRQRQRQVAALGERFGAFFYVIHDTDFRALRPDESRLVAEGGSSP